MQDYKRAKLFIDRMNALLLLIIVFAVSLIVMGVINIKIIPEEFYFSSDGYKDDLYLEQFVRLTMLCGVPRQDTYDQLVSYFNVFGVQLIIYGSILLVLSIICLFVNRLRNVTLLMLTFFASCLTIYLFVTTFLGSSLSLKSIMANFLAGFDFIYSIVVFAVLLFIILPHLVRCCAKFYKENNCVSIKGFCFLLLPSVIILCGIIFNFWLGLAFLDFDPIQDSEFIKMFSNYRSGVFSQYFFVSPSILYCLAICLIIYTLVYLVLLIVKKRNYRC